MSRKSTHKHDYELCIKRRPNSDGYDLINACRICGYRKDPPFKMHLDKRSDGTYRWLVAKEDIFKKYGTLREVL